MILIAVRIALGALPEGPDPVTRDLALATGSVTALASTPVRLPGNNTPAGIYAGPPLRDRPAHFEIALL